MGLNRRNSFDAEFEQPNLGETNELLEMNFESKISKKGGERDETFLNETMGSLLYKNIDLNKDFQKDLETKIQELQ